MVLKTFRSRLFQSGVFFQSGIIVAGTLMGAQVTGTLKASADEFTVSAPSVVTNGSNVVDGNDVLTITGTGSITTAGVDAVNATGATNTITNSGTITTTGNFANGVQTLDNNTVSNSGRITTAGNNAHAIFVRDNTTITNSGTINTTVNSSYGIRSDDNNTITNSGTIITTGSSSYGIYGDGGNTITNSGTIMTSGVNGDGIAVEGDGNTITNSGSITTTGDNSSGLNFFSSSNTVVNSGRITTSGANSYGIRGFDLNTITNSGLVVSAQGDSFNLTGGDGFNTLNLLAPSFIGGAFNLGANTTLNITTGPSQSVLWQFNTAQLVGGAPNVSGTVPSFFNASTGQFATFDPTAFSVAPDALADKSGLISNVVQQRLNGSSGAGGNRVADTSNPNASIMPAGGNNTAATPRGWISVLGSYSEYDGTQNATLDSTLSNVGVVAGYDGPFSANMRLGVLAGYMAGRLDADARFVNSFDNKSSGFFAGVFGRKTMGGTFFDFALTGGVSDNTDERLVNDNLAPLGISQARGKYNGYWVSPEIAIGTNYDTGYSGWIASPTARLRYASQWLDSYTETGPSAANAAVDSRRVAVGEASLEFALTRKVEKLSTTVRAGYIYRKSMGDNSTSVTMIGQTVSIPAFDEDRSIGYVGGNAILEVSNTVNLELGGRFVFGEGVTGVQGNVRLVSAF